MSVSWGRHEQKKNLTTRKYNKPFDIASNGNIDKIEPFRLNFRFEGDFLSLPLRQFNLTTIIFESPLVFFLLLISVAVNNTTCLSGDSKFPAFNSGSVSSSKWAKIEKKMSSFFRGKTRNGPVYGNDCITWYFRVTMFSATAFRRVYVMGK